MKYLWDGLLAKHPAKYPKGKGGTPVLWRHARKGCYARSRLHKIVRTFARGLMQLQVLRELPW